MCVCIWFPFPSANSLINLKNIDRLKFFRQMAWFQYCDLCFDEKTFAGWSPTLTRMPLDIAGSTECASFRQVVIIQTKTSSQKCTENHQWIFRILFTLLYYLSPVLLVFVFSRATFGENLVISVSSSKFAGKFEKYWRENFVKWHDFNIVPCVLTRKLLSGGSPTLASKCLWRCWIEWVRDLQKSYYESV